MWGGFQWPQSKIRKSTNSTNYIGEEKLIRKTGQSKILRSMENFSNYVTKNFDLKLKRFQSAAHVLLMDKIVIVNFFYKNLFYNFEQNSFIKKVYRKSIIENQRRKL